jgi:adenosine/AMP kinase
MSIAQGHVFVLSSSQKCPINIYLKVNCYEDMGILKLEMVDCSPVTNI